jgi:Tfp pilus assembly protein PilN
MRVAGLSIEGAVLRAAIVERKFRTIVHVRSEEVSLPREEEPRCEAIRHAINAWKTEYGIEGIVVGIGMGEFTHAYVQLPVISRRDARRALDFEMEKYLPLPPEEYLFDFSTAAAADGTSTNLVFAIRREKLRWLVPCMAETGVKLMGVRATAVEVLNEVLVAEHADKVLFLHPEGAGRYIFGVEDGRPVLMRTASSDDKAVALLDHLSERFTRGIVAGEHLDTARYSHLGVRYVGYSTAYVLAVSALRRQPVRMDFTPEALRPPRRDTLPTLTLALAALAVALFFMTSLVSYYRVFSALQDVNARIAEIKSSSSELLQIRRELEDIEKKKKFLAGRRARSNRHIAVLRQVSIVLPEDAWLTRFSSSDTGHIDIEGYARRTADLVRPIEGSPLLRNVSLSAPVTVRDNLERFSLTMEFEG